MAHPHQETKGKHVSQDVIRRRRLAGTALAMLVVSGALHVAPKVYYSDEPEIIVHYTVNPGDNPWTIDRAFHPDSADRRESVNNIHEQGRRNNLDQVVGLYPGQVVTVENPQEGTYTIDKQGFAELTNNNPDINNP